jgi:hypothetical protein
MLFFLTAAVGISVISSVARGRRTNTDAAESPATAFLNQIQEKSKMRTNGVRDTYAFITAHDKRRLVEKVDYVSHPGKKVCRENEFYGGGPKWIVTPKCIFDFDPDTLEARLAQVFTDTAAAVPPNVQKRGL